MEHQSKEEVLGTILADTGALLEELYQSGFDTVHDSTLSALTELAGLTEQYGMAYLSELLGSLTEGLSMRRHQTEREREGGDNLAGLYTRLNEYLYLCEEKTLYDKGRDYYEEA